MEEQRGEWIELSNERTLTQKEWKIVDKYGCILRYMY